MKILLTLLTTGLLILGIPMSGHPAQQMPAPTPGRGGFGMPMFDPMGMMAMMMGGGFGRGAMGQRPGVGPFLQQGWNYRQPPAQAQLPALQGQPEEEAVQMFAPMIRKADQDLNTLLLQEPLDLIKIQRKVRQLDVLRTQQRLAQQEVDLKAKEQGGAAPQPQQR